MNLTLKRRSRGLTLIELTVVLLAPPLVDLLGREQLVDPQVDVLDQARTPKQAGFVRSGGQDHVAFANRPRADPDLRRPSRGRGQSRQRTQAQDEGSHAPAGWAALCSWLEAHLRQLY